MTLRTSLSSALACSLRRAAFPALLFASTAASATVTLAQDVSAQVPPSEQRDTATVAAAAPSPGELPFSTLTYPAAREAAAQEGKLLIVNATASWCIPCRRMEHDTWPAEEVVTWLAAHAIAVQIDVDAQKDVAAELKVNAMPLIVVFRGDTELDRHEGAMSAADLLNWLEAVEAGQIGHDPVRAEGFRLLNSEDLLARCEIAHQLVLHGDYDLALKHYLWIHPRLAELNDHPVVLGTRVAVMSADVVLLARVDDDCNEAFTKVWMDFRAEVINTSSPDTLAFGRFMLWSTLLGRQDAILDWYDKHHAPDGSVEVDDAVRKWLFETLVGRSRWMEAGQLGGLSKFADSWVAGCRQYEAEVRADPQYSAESRRQLLEAYQEELRNFLSKLCAASWAAHHDGEARSIANSLLEEVDDAESRLVLVEATFSAVGRIPEQNAWLADAMRKGGDAQRIKLLRLRIYRPQSKVEPRH